MNEDSINIYLNALKTGSKRRRDINLVVVGKKGVGKTSLVRRLFGEQIKDVKSTNGIEIHRQRCRINLSDWEWKKIPGKAMELHIRNTQKYQITHISSWRTLMIISKICFNHLSQLMFLRARTVVL